MLIMKTCIHKIPVFWKKKALIKSHFIWQIIDFIHLIVSNKVEMITQGGKNPCSL